MSYPITNLPNLKRCCDDYRARGYTIGMTAGCFDILHVGHVRLLEELHRVADVVIVSLNTDWSVRRLKGDQRPFNNQYDRAEVLNALATVSHVVLHDADDPTDMVRSLRPHIYMKGGDYDPVTLPERFYVELYGGKVLKGPLVQGHSTTALAGRLSASTGILERS